MRQISLDGDWELTHFVEGSTSVRHPDDLARAGGETLPARVPGNVELDLQRAGRLPDPFYGDNVHLLRPLEFHEWWYRRRFAAPEHSPGQRAVLCFGGLDCIATIWVNGQEVGWAENMLIEHRFDVTGILRPGDENEVVVRL
ncbi:MAG TPA: glycoside hydrolase family 2, partial [Armatimonadota bacterium]|nr:glycoside hydrolase family 2 [Armatimonadota bacterium]